jgi:hypothetical protein
MSLLDRLLMAECYQVTFYTREYTLRYII